MNDCMQHRRLLLKLLLGSPLLGLAGCATEEKKKEAAETIANLLDNPADAINVFDFEAMAKQKLPPAHFGYLATGVNDDLTLHANREAFAQIKLRMQRLGGITDPDMSVKLFGRTWSTPIILDPVGSQRAFHPDGEVATARAAKKLNHLQILSTVSTTSVEEVTKERGAPIWYQLYAMNNWEGNLEMIKRAEAAGAEALVFTVDLTAGDDNRETLRRMIKLDERVCADCHSKENYFSRKPMVSPIKDAEFEPAVTWDYVDKIRASTKMKLLIKGLETAEDAQRCLDHQIDGIIVSNHGGRASETGRGTLECLPEIVNVIKGKIPVLIDGGFRRGTDIFKALALGADAICIGRPYIWGLASFGQEGVEAVLKMLTAEFSMTMRQAGTASLKEINGNYLA
jgi:4-hydroxymandelate oxidase